MHRVTQFTYSITRRIDLEYIAFNAKKQNYIMKKNFHIPPK